MKQEQIEDKKKLITQTLEDKELQSTQNQNIAKRKVDISIIEPKKELSSEEDDSLADEEYETMTDFYSA